MIYTLEEYCCQTAAKLLATTGVFAPVGTLKIDILIQSAPYYLQKKLITEETKNIITDPRFNRLYRARVPDLKQMLTNNNILPSKSGKPYIASLCYTSGLDVQFSPSNEKKLITNSSDDGSSEETINAFNSLSESDLSTLRFFRNNNKIYLGSNNFRLEITNSMLLELFKLLLPVSPSLLSSYPLSNVITNTTTDKSSSFPLSNVITNITTNDKSSSFPLSNVIPNITTSSIPLSNVINNTTTNGLSTSSSIPLSNVINNTTTNGLSTSSSSIPLSNVINNTTNELSSSSSASIPLSNIISNATNGLSSSIPLSNVISSITDESSSISLSNVCSNTTNGLSSSPSIPRSNVISNTTDESSFQSIINNAN